MSTISLKFVRPLATLALGCATFAALPQAAHALTAKECHQQFKDAKTAGTLDGQTYKAFKAAKCGATTSAPAAATSTTPATGSTATTPATAAAAPATAAPTAAAAATPAVSSGNIVFPTSVAAKYSSESAGKARMHTCLDQYHANKTSGGNGSLKWIQKGGGYYSQCNAKLKG